MRTTRAFMPGDRYEYDFGGCSYANGWAQFDSDQDASYYGMWVNPDLLALFCYCEGDTTHHRADSREEFVDMLQKITDFEIAQGRRAPHIDPGFGEEMKRKLIEVGAGPFLHPEPEAA